MSQQFLRSKPPWRILFFGTDEFSLKTLQALNENRMSSSHGGHSVVDKLDITHPLQKKLSPVNKYAMFCGLAQHKWPLQVERCRDYDVGVVASFGHLIPGKVVNMFPYGILNVHPSLLPRWRGAAPLHHTILSGDTVTGISIMSIQPKHFDRGPILAQKEIPVSPSATLMTLRDTLAPQGGDMILQVLSQLPELLSSSKPQDSEGVTYAHKILLPKTFIDWHSQTLSQLRRQYKALYETLELRSEWQGSVVRLLDMVKPEQKPAIPLDASSPPGLPVYDKMSSVLWVRCKDDWAGFSSILLKKKMSAKAFHNGYLTKADLKGVCFKSINPGLFNEDYTKWIAKPRPP